MDAMLLDMLFPGVYKGAPFKSFATDWLHTKRDIRKTLGVSFYYSGKMVSTVCMNTYKGIFGVLTTKRDCYPRWFWFVPGVHCTKLFKDFLVSNLFVTCEHQPLHQPVNGHQAQYFADLLMMGPVLFLTVLRTVVHVQTPWVRQQRKYAIQS